VRKKPLGSGINAIHFWAIAFCSVTAIAYPRGTICAALGLFSVLAYYLRRERTRARGGILPQADEYPITDSRYWTSRRDVLVGASLSALFLAIASGADLPTPDPVDWGLHTFVALAAATAFGTLLLGCIFLWHHWIEVVADFREWSPNLFQQFTEKPESSEREEMAPMRSSLLMHSFLGLCAILLAGWLAARFGIVPERLLDNPFLGALYGHVVWIFILTFVIVLWTTRSRIAAVVRVCVLLMFSLIILSATVFFAYWVASESAPALAGFCAGIVVVNFVFYYRFERAAVPTLSVTVIRE
jgi:hypothetical protein